MVAEEARVNVESQSEAGRQDQRGRNIDVGTGRYLWFKALVGIVASPRSSFEIIRARQPWAAALFVALFVLALAFLPFDRLLAAAMNAGREPLGIPYGMAAIIAAGMPIALLLQALVIRLLAAAFQGEARFHQCFSLVVHLSVITALGGLVLSILRTSPLSGRIESARSAVDRQPGFGFDDLGPFVDAVPGTMLGLMARFSFSVWFVVLLGLGAAAVFRLPKRIGFAIAALHWAAETALSAGLESVGEIVTSSVR